MSGSFRRRPARAQDSTHAFFERLDRERAGRRLVVWGAGRAGEIAVRQLMGAGCVPALIVDRDRRKWEAAVEGIPVAPVEQIAPGDYILLASMHAPSMRAELETAGLSEGKDFREFPGLSLYRPEFGFMLDALPPLPENGRPCIGPESHSGQHVTLFASSRGNFFFRELRDFLAEGLRRGGWSVSVADELSEDPTGISVIVGPHEFFSIGEGIDWFSEENLAASVLITTEQSQSLWFRQFLPAAARARAVLDLSPAVVACYARAGVRAEWLPLGWYDRCDPFDRISCGTIPASLQDVALDCGPLPDLAGDLWEGRPIDVLCIASHSPRRENLLGRLNEELSDLRCFIHIPRSDVPLATGHPEAIGAATFVALSRRSKILLNIHRDEAPYFECQRVVWRGMWQRTLVATEPCGEYAPFTAGIDFVEMRAEEMAGRIRNLLADQARADEIRTAGCNRARSIGFSRTAEVLGSVIAGTEARGWP